MPWRSLGKYPRYRNYSAEVDRLARAYHFGHSLVFLPPNDYQLAFVFNPPTLDGGGTVYAADAGPVHREAVRRYFADRPVWFIARSPTARHRIEVLAGPLPPENQNHKEQESTRIREKDDALARASSLEKNGGRQ
jgi:hypothetical protein